MTTGEGLPAVLASAFNAKNLLISPNDRSWLHTGVIKMKNLVFFAFFCTFLTGCAGIQMPPGQENTRTFTQESNKSYQEAYRLISKQMRACYRAIGLFGNGYDIQADLDAENKRGTVEVYYVGLTGAQKPEDSIFSRTVTISEAPNGSIITTTGTTPNYVYLTHKTIPTWLAGVDSCGPK